MWDEDNADKNQFKELIQGLIDKKYGSFNDFLLLPTIIG